MPAQLTTYPNFIGSTYNSRSISADGERAINLFVEPIESKAGKSAAVLYKTPGTKLLMSLPTSPLYGLFAFEQRSWAVSGSTVYELFPNQTFNAVGTVSAPLPGSYASFAANPVQLLIVTNPNGYTLNFASGGAVQQINTAGAGSGFNGGVTATMIDGYFVVNNPNSNGFSVSNFNDGTTWQGINQQATQDYGDNLMGVANLLHYLELFGSRHSEAYYDSGSNSTIFARYEGSFAYTGICAPFAMAYLDNTIFFLGQNEAGGGMAYRLKGFSPQRISNFSCENAWQQYGDLSKTTGFSYQENGHLFYVLNFPNGASWAYDASSSQEMGESQWHERGFWNSTIAQYTAPYASFHCYAWPQATGGTHLVGGGDGTGNIYAQSMNYLTDNGNPIRWLRSAPHLSTMMTRNFYREFMLDMQVGAGLDGGVVPGSAPMVGMQYSDDGGFSWGNEVEKSAGMLGQFRARCIWEGCGEARDRCFRVFGSDPTVTCLLGAYLRVEQGNS